MTTGDVLYLGLLILITPIWYFICTKILDFIFDR